MRNNWKDDVFSGNRKYQMINNSDGTVSFVDKTTYTQQGDKFGAKEVNDIANDLNSKQSALVSGTNIKTINGESLLGEGNIFIKGGTLSSEVTATRADVLKGKTTIMHDSNDKIEQGTLEVQSIVNFNLSLYASETVMGAWQLPARGLYSGVRIMTRTDRFPDDPHDGTVVYEGSGINFTKKLTPNIRHYFTAFSYVTTNYGRLYASVFPKAEFMTTIVEGRRVYKSNGTFVVPQAVRQIKVFMVGGGGGGSSTVGSYDAGGGGGGGKVGTFTVSVTPGQVLNVFIGAGGKANTNGGTTSVSGVGSVNGGNAGTRNGGNGSSGGGAGADASGSNYGQNGGSDGSDGGGGNAGGKGEGTTTREFGEPSGTLYSGGGGGGNKIGYKNGGKGGNGGGGNGGSQNTKDQSPRFEIPPTAGTDNSGSGGGGGSGLRSNYGSYQQGANGGTGIVIIQWG